MNKETVIWGRRLPLKIEFDCYDDEQVLESQIQAEEEFFNSKYVDLALVSLKSYCIQDSGVESIDNVFKYVMPKGILIKRQGENEVVLLCDYRFDPEHGLAIVFKDGKVESISSQDEVV